MNKSIAIVYHSGYGHTAKVAQHVALGARKHPYTNVVLLNVDDMKMEDWETINAADAVVFGAPTYMGGVSASFKQFMDGTTKQWKSQRWKNKLAGGFTNSGAFCGDKLNALLQLVVFSMQHGMIWVGTGQMIEKEQAGSPPGPLAINRLGSYVGVATYAENESPEITPPEGDLKTAELYGARIAKMVTAFKQQE